MADQDPITGQWLPGNRASVGRGRPPAAQERQYLSALRRACPPERVAEVVGRLAELALSGDVQAARVLLGYVLPPPAQRLQIDAQERVEQGDELRVAGKTVAELDAEMLARARRILAAGRGEEPDDDPTGDQPEEPIAPPARRNGSGLLADLGLATELRYR